MLKETPHTIASAPLTIVVSTTCTGASTAAATVGTTADILADSIGVAIEQVGGVVAVGSGGEGLDVSRGVAQLTQPCTRWCNNLYFNYYKFISEWC